MRRGLIGSGEKEMGEMEARLAVVVVEAKEAEEQLALAQVTDSQERQRRVMLLLQRREWES